MAEDTICDLGRSTLPHSSISTLDDQEPNRPQIHHDASRNDLGRYTFFSNDNGSTLEYPGDHDKEGLFTLPLGTSRGGTENEGTEKDKSENREQVYDALMQITDLHTEENIPTMDKSSPRSWSLEWSPARFTRAVISL